MAGTPDYQSLMLPVLEVAAKGETSVPLAEAYIAARFGLSDAERTELLPSGRQRLLHNRIHWAKFYLTKAGFLESSRRGRFFVKFCQCHCMHPRPPRILDATQQEEVPQHTMGPIPLTGSRNYSLFFRNISASRL